MKKKALREKFTNFEQILKEKLAVLVAQVLQAKDRITYIGFITTDDFYGAFITWNQAQENNIWESCEWKADLSSGFLYQPLVDIVENDQEINFMAPCPEKWLFAETLMDVFRDALNQIPEDVFMDAGYKRDEIIFFMTMSDGDYMDEMMITSVELWNSQEAIQHCLSADWKTIA